MLLVLRERVKLLFSKILKRKKKIKSIILIPILDYNVVHKVLFGAS